MGLYISWGMPNRYVVVPLILTGKCMAGHMEGGYKGLYNQGGCIKWCNCATRYPCAQKGPWQKWCWADNASVSVQLLGFFSRQAGVAEELDLELLLPCISHRISSFRARVLRRKQILAQLRQSHAQSCMLSKQRLQPKCLPAVQRLWGSGRSSLSLSWARRNMGSTIHPSCTAGNGLAEEGFLVEASVEKQLRLASFSLPLFCPAHCACTLGCRAVELVWLKIVCSLHSENGQVFVTGRCQPGGNSLGK